MNLGEFIGDHIRRVKSIFDNFEKGKVVPVGTIVTRKNGVREQKTADGWKYLGRETAHKEPKKEESKEVHVKKEPEEKKKETVVYPETYDEAFVEAILKKHGATTIPFKPNKDLTVGEIAAKRELFGYLKHIGVLIGTPDSNIRNGRSKYYEKHLAHAVKLVAEDDLNSGTQKFLKLGLDVKDSNIDLSKMFEKLPVIKDQHEFMDAWCRIQQKKLGHLVKVNNLLTPKTRKLIIDCAKAGLNINDTPDNFYSNLHRLDDLMLENEKTFLDILEFRGHYKMNKKFNGIWNRSDALVLKNIENFANQIPNGHLINNPKLLAFGKYEEDRCKYAHYNSGRREIAFSPTAVRRGQIRGDLNNPTEFEHVFTHELGHAVSEKIESQYKQMFKKFAIMMGWNEYTWNKHATGSQPDVPRANPRYTLISNYAAKSSEECFAEYYSMYVQNKSKIDKYLEDNKDTAVFNTADTALTFKDGRNHMRASTLFLQREVFKFFKNNVFSENFIKAYGMDLFEIHDEFEKGKAATIGEIRTWKNNRRYRRVQDGWEEVIDDHKSKHDIVVENGKVQIPEEYMKRKNKELAKNIESAGYIADYKLTPQEYKFKKAIDDLGFKDFDYEKIKTDLDKLFNLNGSMTVNIEFTGGDDDFGKGVYVSYYATPQNTYINAKRQKITITRAFYIKDGELCVSHDYLNIPNNLQNKGFGKQILKMYHEQYKKIGVTKIDLLANSTVGGYAWGKYGFSANKEMLDSLVKHNIPFESASMTPEKWKEYKPYVTKVISDYFKKNKSSKMFPMRLICDMEINGKKVGKDILLGVQWYGELDLNDVKQLAIFERYLEDETKSKQETLEALKKLPKTIESDAIFKHGAAEKNSDIMENYKKVYKGLLKNGLNEHDIFSLAKVEDINIHDIYPVDKELDNETIKHFIENKWDRMPYGIKIGKGYYVVDGHSRIAGAILQNKQVVKMKIYEYKA